jgi:hypothetical protein
MSSRTKRGMPAVDTKMEFDFRLKKIALITETLSAICSGFCKWGGFAFIAYCLWQTAAALSGEETSANIVFRAALDMKVDQYAAYLFGGGGIIYGIRERRLRRKTIARLTERTESLERRIDTNRTSSGLLSSGDSRQEDK